MPFRLDTAMETLRRVIDSLSREWPALEPDTRERLRKTVSQHAREIANVPTSVFANRLVSFLQALWDQRDALPPAAVEALLAGQGMTKSPPAAADGNTRQALLASILRLTDPRWYPNAPGLALAVSGLLTGNADRLTDTDQAWWRQLETSYQASGDADAYLEGIGQRLGQYPAVAALLEQGKSWQPEPVTVRGLMPQRQVAPVAQAPTDKVRCLSRYANLHFPAVVLLGQKVVPLIVLVAAEWRGVALGQAGQVPPEELHLQAGDLTLVLHPDDFKLAGAIGGRGGSNPLARVVQVSEGHDSEPVVFFLAPATAGEKRLRVDVYQSGRNLATLVCVTSVSAEAAPSELACVATGPEPLALPDPAARPPDLELRVTLGTDRRTLIYTLHSPGGSDYNFQPAGSVTLNGDPRDLLQRNTARLNVMARRSGSGRSGADSKRTMAELADMGANLYAELFPRELKNEYRKLRREYASKSILITSDEPWIPWELIRPVEFDDKGVAIYDDPFLCEKFQVARWLAGRGPVDQFVVRQAALVAPSDNLAAVKDEADYFARLYRQQWNWRLQSPLGTVADIEQSFIEGSTNLYHFACHGNFDLEDPNDSKLKLADGFLQPSHIIGARQAGLRRAQPLVFLNACHTGEVGFALTGLGGWAERFLAAGASAFVGSLWEINDVLAARFAAEFYNRLWGLGEQAKPLPLGQAFYGARMAIKRADPANPTWLAYVLYGDPYCMVALGSGKDEARG